MDNTKDFLYANIIVNISHESVDRPFTYRIPEELMGKIETGMSVFVPFGKGSKIRQGYVIELTDRVTFEEDKIKEIKGIADGDAAVDALFIKLAAWIRMQYGSTMIAALKTVLPARYKKKRLEKKEIVRLLSAEESAERAKLCTAKNRPAMARILEALSEEERLPYELVKEKLHISPATLTSLEKQGALRIETVHVYRNPIAGVMEKDSYWGETQNGKRDAGSREGASGVQRGAAMQKEALPGHKYVPVLSHDQQYIVDSILKDYDSGVRKTYLIHGITGSGKTEVYMNLIAGCLVRGKQAVMLIPEIALTYQTVIRFYRRFGNRVSVLHSGLSAGEKYDQCERAKNGDIDVIIGPRSALFTPFSKLGLIIIDEEHEPSYKSETMPKYHARETAVYLASLHGASVVLGSATPSLESFYKARQGEYGYFSLKERLTGNMLPEVHLADLQQELREGNRSVFSRKLQGLIEDRLEKKEQIMLFINRRGYAGFVSCRSCGYVAKCPHCDVSLSEHKNGKLTCHYCGYEQPVLKKCPECASPYIMGFKAGTEAVEERLCQMYPKARVLRMDGDTTKRKDSYEKILSDFSDRKADILLGTQMIVKGHDFPAVTLVGILAADMSLFAGDYRAAERTFQLLTQAAGRAGRGSVPGEVVIQTYQPEHYSIVHAAAQNYEGFYEEEILYREMGQYPPAAHMLAVLVSGEKEREAGELAEYLASMAREEVMTGKAYTECEKTVVIPKNRQGEQNEKKVKSLSVLGPGAASLSKLNDSYRFVFYIKSTKAEKLTEIRDRMEKYLQTLQKRTEQVQFDFDPMSGY